MTRNKIITILLAGGLIISVFFNAQAIKENKTKADTIVTQTQKIKALSKTIDDNTINANNVKQLSNENDLLKKTNTQLQLKPQWSP